MNTHDGERVIMTHVRCGAGGASRRCDEAMTDGRVLSMYAAT